MSSRNLRLVLVVLLCASFLVAQKHPFPAPARRTAQNAGPGQAGRYPIVELTTTGSERFDAEDVLKSTGLKKDKTIETPLEDVQAAAQRLVNSGAFAQVSYKHSAAPGGMKVEFVLSDKDDDQFVKCDFANIVWLPENDLLVELHDRAPLFNGTVPRDGTLADDVAKALQALLKERGVAANVADEHADAINGDPSTEMISYRVADIDIKVAKVELNGASGEMQAEAAATSKQISGLIYNRTTVKRFIDHNLHNVYLKHGYLKAKFGEPQITVLPDSTSAITNIAINVPVTEGGIYKWGGLRWTGNTAMLADSLTPYLHFDPGKVVDGMQLTKDIDKLRAHYASLGYLHMTLTPRPSFDDAANVANFDMPIKEGDLFSMGKFDVEGLDKNSAERMRQSWQLREGEPFDPTYLKDFFRKFRMPPNTAYLVDEVEGERPKSVDVTILFCAPTDPCKPKNETRLYTPPVSEEDK